MIRPPKLIPTEPTIRSKLDRFRFEIADFISNIMDILMKKLNKKEALEIGSEILQKKRNDLYQLKLKD